MSEAETTRSTCLSPFCGTRLPRKLEQCPQCGRQMFGAAEIARRGRHVLQLGLILAGVIGAVLWFWSPGMLRTISGAPATSFIGSPDQARAILLALGMLLLTGLAFCLSGLRMIAGRSSRAATIAAIGLFVSGCLVLGFVLVGAYTA